MPDKPRPQMPQDWDDHAGWDAYYMALSEVDSNFDMQLSLHDAMVFLGHISHQRYRKIWFPGCGISWGPLVYGALGFEVWASDVSTIVIVVLDNLHDSPWQERLDLDQLREQLPETRPAGPVHFQVHDFRTAFDAPPIDCILNLRSFQGLPIASMRAAARVHWDALRPGGEAFFSTMNVQGGLRDTIEDVLIEAGFLLPSHESEAWYRKTLRETGIPHFFILDNPIVSRGEQYHGQAKYEQDQQYLRSFKDEYQQRRAAEWERLNTIVEANPDVKIAHVVYNTG